MPRPRALRLLAVLCVMVATLLQFCEATQATGKCMSSSVCRPYDKTGPACVRKGPINLRFILQTCRENNFIVDGKKHYISTYSFCPTVDEFSSFTLAEAPFLATSFQTTGEGNDTTDYHLSKNLEPRYLSVYGFGLSNSTAYPQVGLSPGAVLVAMDGFKETGIRNSVGVVTMLSLEIGLHNGRFNYIGATAPSESTIPNPNYNPSLCVTDPSLSMQTTTTAPLESINYCDKEINVKVAETAVQPAKVGFVPTCDAQDRCVAGDSKVFHCIGDVPGKKNCGVYLSNPREIRDLQLTVLVSYYGTDARKHVLISGGKNPLSYITFTGSNALRYIGDKISSLFDGKLPFLPL
ncbi:hypothetical protein JKF63_03084 [Porcisia hertigi]|uniref:Uncharacterized protein n=1 Tax=Porcisia hertigi TaxID=2761500 RepID=A0A836I8I1_9TRYP|nr:hypothetical protein JKF63_03084 [Porcisia hertigi]